MLEAIYAEVIKCL